MNSPWPIKNENGKTVKFKWFIDDESNSIDLGVPENVAVEKGNWRDGGCYFTFSTSKLAIGIEERFMIYLFAEDIIDITKKIWKAYLQTEPQRAKEDFKKVFDELNSIIYPIPEDEIIEAKSVLCCNECETPLETSSGGGKYCPKCNFYPSMQDTFIMMLCPTDNTKLKRFGDNKWRCPKCNTTYK